MSDGDFIHVSVSQFSPDVPESHTVAINNPVQSSEENQRRGSWNELILGLFIGYVLHIVALVCVFITQIILGRFNRKLKVGVIAGSFLYLAFVIYNYE